MKRSFLLLQGVCSPFFGRLADRLQADGHAVHKINFNGGDIAYWAPRKATLFRDRVETLPKFLEPIWSKYAITDQILFGDCRPVHKDAVLHAESFGIRNHVFEEGYFRPYWITLEREGVNGHSLLPRDPDWFREVGKRLPDPVKPQAFHSPFSIRAIHDVVYHLAGLSNPALFPHYKNHAPYIAPVEYAGYIGRFLLLNLRKRLDKVSIAQLLHEKTPFYLLPLQLSSDAQIVAHSRFQNMVEVIEHVMHSFANHAPTNARLVIKNHPLDAGLVNYRKIIKQFEKQFDLASRIIYLESGDLNPLVKHAAGTITVNSTVGGLALEFNCPTIALSDPIYNLPGLTFQESLDAFWKNALPPEAELFKCYRNTVIYATQVNGGFYSNSGIALAVHSAGKFLVADKSPLEELL
jgi:capsular polysaccharide export protein